MKKYALPLAMCVVLLLVLFNINRISLAIVHFLSGDNEIVILPSNEYKLDYDFIYIEQVEEFVPYSFGDLLDIYYTVLNNGWETFTFYCPKEYTKCVSDLKRIDDTLLTHISNYVHPYNSFEDLVTIWDPAGEVTIRVERLYSDDDIKMLNEVVDKLLVEIITEEDTEDFDKLLKIHDYIINNTKYDIERNQNNDSPYRSTTAHGPLLDGYAMCGGYADAMAIFLNELNIPNYKIAVPPDEEDESDKGHVWNAVYIDGKWLHLDLTWDDPVDQDDPSKDYLYHKYFLVNNNTLFEEDGSYARHGFDTSIYLEFKN